MRRFLKYELDNYLADRGGELVEELPLLRVENQPYIHYRKGSVVMYALKDALGEERLNRAIRRYVADTPFPGAALHHHPGVRRLPPRGDPARAARPGQGPVREHHPLREPGDRGAEYARLDDGRYEVTLAVESQKLRADGLGVETEVPVDIWVDIGVFGEKEEGGPARAACSSRSAGSREPTTEIALVVDEEPVRAGIDPYHKLVDRNPENNLTRVTAAES